MLYIPSLPVIVAGAGPVSQHGADTHVGGDFLETLINIPSKFSKGYNGPKPLQNTGDISKTSSYG